MIVDQLASLKPGDLNQHCFQNRNYQNSAGQDFYSAIGLRVRGPFHNNSEI